MTEPQLVSIISAVTGSAIISLGMVLQKKGVAWFTWKRELRDRNYRRARRTWILGFTFHNTLSVFYYFALQHLTASVVGAMMGLNIVFTAIFSAIFLGEHVSRRVASWSVALVAGIAAANFTAPPYVEAEPPPFGLMALCFALPYLVAGTAEALKRLKALRGEAYGVAFAAASGMLEGFIIVLIKAMQAQMGNHPLSFFLSPYLYMYVLASASIISFMQVAYAHGRLSRMGPVLWGTQIIWPVIVTFILFRVELVPSQALAFAWIAFSVVMVQSQP